MVLLKLAEIRKAKGLTQEQLAAASGITGRCISRAESGKGVYLLTAKAIAKTLKIKLEELI